MGRCSGANRLMGSRRSDRAYQKPALVSPMSTTSPRRNLGTSAAAAATHPPSALGCSRSRARSRRASWRQAPIGSAVTGAVQPLAKQCTAGTWPAGMGGAVNRVAEEVRLFTRVPHAGPECRLSEWGREGREEDAAVRGRQKRERRDLGSLDGRTRWREDMECKEKKDLDGSRR